jgi:hypothetical protein
VMQSIADWRDENINGQRPMDPYSDNDMFKRTTPLLVAISRGASRLVKRLLELGADPDAATGAYGERTVLHMASLFNQSEIVGILVDAGVSMEQKDTIYGWTALHLAVSGCHLYNKTVRMLLAKGANVNATDHDGRTPLHIALEYVYPRSQRDLLHILLAGGADLSAKTVDGMYPDAGYVEQWRPDWDSDEDEDERSRQGMHKREIKTLLDEERLRRGAGGLAFAMGQHERLGAKSWVQYLEPDVVRMVMQYV